MLQHLLTIKRVKGMGFTLNETQEILHLLYADPAILGDIAERINNKVSGIEQKIAALISLREPLRSSVKRCVESCTPSAQIPSCGLVRLN